MDTYKGRELSVQAAQISGNFLGIISATALKGIFIQMSVSETLPQEKKDPHLDTFLRDKNTQ